MQGQGIAKLLYAHQNKMDVSYTVRVLTSMWADSGEVVVIGLLGRLCLIFLIKDGGRLYAPPGYTPTLLGTPDAALILAARTEQTEELLPDSLSVDFWTPERILPSVYNMLGEYAADTGRDQYWRTQPRPGCGVPLGENINVSLVPLLIMSTHDTMRLVHEVLAEEIQQEAENPTLRPKDQSRKFPAPLTIPKAQVTQEAIEAAKQSLAVVREIKGHVYGSDQRPSGPTHAEMQAILNFLGSDLAQIQKKLTDAMRGSIIGRAFVAEPAVEA